MKSIQSKILVVVISALLVITAVVSAIAVNMTHEIMHKDADRILSNATQKEAAIINDTLGDVKKSATIMQHYATSEITDLDSLKDEQFYNNYIAKTKKMFTEIAINTNGVKGYFFRINPDYAGGTAGYYNIINDNKELQEMTVTDLTKYEENDAKNVGWYYTPVRAGKGIWLEPYYFPGHETRFISYSIPLFIDSELLGVVGFDLDFDYLVTRIEGISVYERGYAALISRDGSENYCEEKTVEGNDPHTKANVELLNGMQLELRADYKDIQRDIHPMLTKIVVAFLIVLVVSIIYTIFVTYRIVRPLKKLTSFAADVSDSIDTVDTESIPIDSKDEVGTLSKVMLETYEKIKEYNTYINALAYRDSLTGIKNSTAYAEVVKEFNNEINRDNPRFGVLVADINNLKETNDKYGHDVGNELIVHTAKILTDTFKMSSVYRIGGDEFAVILKDNDFKDYHTLLQKLDNAYREDYITVFDETIPISVARGVASFDPEIDRIYEDVFAKADHAMYLDKEAKKSAVV